MATLPIPDQDVYVVLRSSDDRLLFLQSDGTFSAWYHGAMPLECSKRVGPFRVTVASEAHNKYLTQLEETKLKERAITELQKQLLEFEKKVAHTLAKKKADVQEALARPERVPEAEARTWACERTGEWSP